MTKWTQAMLDKALEDNPEIRIISDFGGNLPKHRSNGESGGGMFSNAKRTVSECGEVFQSEGEYNRWMQLKLYEQCGIVSCITRQNKWILQYGYIDENGKKVQSSGWTDDFQYILHSFADKPDQWIIEDWKRGSQTKENKRIISIARKKYRVKILINDGDLSLIPGGRGNSIDKMQTVKSRIENDERDYLAMLRNGSSISE